MAKSSNASPEVFGFDFQVNATIFLLLDNIKDIKTVRMEGASEDIELTMNDGNQIMAQAKGVVKGSSDFSHVRSKLSDAIAIYDSWGNCLLNVFTISVSDSVFLAFIQSFLCILLHWYYLLIATDLPLPVSVKDDMPEEV